MNFMVGVLIIMWPLNNQFSSSSQLALQALSAIDPVVNSTNPSS